MPSLISDHPTPLPNAPAHSPALFSTQCGACWYCCDDAWVHQVEEEVVAACQAYMLFYLNK